MSAKEFTTKAEFDEFLSDSKHAEKLIVIKFYAEWCGPCRKMKPFFRKCCEKFPDVLFAKVEVDEADEEIAGHIEVMPTFCFYKNGVELYSYCGSNECMLEEKIECYK